MLTVSNGEMGCAPPLGECDVILHQPPISIGRANRYADERRELRDGESLLVMPVLPDASEHKRLDLPNERRDNRLAHQVISATPTAPW